MKHHQQAEWDEKLEAELRQLVRSAVYEDLDRLNDWTTVALVSPDATAKAFAVSRGEGVVAGVRAGCIVLDEMESRATWRPQTSDGSSVSSGECLAEIEGPARDILTAERILLNIVGRLCGVATLTQSYVQAVAGAPALICDTRKTTPGWRRLEKYAVRCGDGTNHRCGLFDAVLIKDNHLAFFRDERGPEAATPAAAVRHTREFLSRAESSAACDDMIVEIEVDTLQQLQSVLQERPDIVLLDNMSPEQLRQAVRLRDQSAPGVQLEASGGVALDTVRQIAETGVDRISVGALTHSAPIFDVGLDWDR